MILMTLLRKMAMMQQALWEVSHRRGDT
jgi:hypothetical protein